MQRTVAVVASLAFLLSPVAEAASGVILQDLGPAHDLLEDIDAEETRQEESLPFYNAEELFPGTGEAEEGMPAFLSIRVGGMDVVLRDVPNGMWFTPYIRDIAELGLVSGYRDAQGNPTGLFGPADPVTLEQMAKVAVLAAGIDATTCPLPPKNLSASGAWSGSYVRCAELRDWAVYGDAASDLRRPATREEVVMTILQAFNRAFDVDPATITFTDVEKTSAYAFAIAKASADGVVSGYSDAQGNPTGIFGPTNNVTRAEFSKIVSIALQLYAD